MKKMGDQKSQATLGSTGTRPLSKKELQEQRKKEEEEAAAHVFQEFVETFQEAPIKSSKVWIKAGTYDAGARKEDNSERGKLYKPQSRLGDEKKSSAEQAQEFARMLASKDDRLGKRRGDKDKKKSNLEMFKEELRQIQEAREERHKFKGILRTTVPELEVPCYTKDEVPGSFDNGDPTTTNLYLGNLNPKVTEPQLKEIFGRYGPLASIKIMWPRSDEEKARQRNCGFVAFMSRKDGERALRCLNGKEVLSYEMKMGWGKAVTIPSAPIYIPPSLQVPLQPPPPSGLPFNAQPPRHLAHKIPRLRPGEPFPTDPEDRKLFDQILSQSLVRVVIPTERSILVLIHRMVEFVIREGPMFEAMIMNKELNNPYFSFLFENQSPGHVYYRWKLYSLLQGDMPKAWANKDFRMFKGGSVWRPPTMNVYTQGMPEELVEEDEVVKDNRGTLSKTQRERLEDLIRQLTPERTRVAEAMVFCMEHAEAADEIATCVAESLSSNTTALRKKVARLYLVSDILHNCGIKLTNASFFRKSFQERLVDIMRAQHEACAALTSRLQSEGFRARVARVLLAWEDWAVYPKDFLIRLNNTFMGVEEKVEEEIPEHIAAVMEEGSGSDGGGSDEEASSDGGGGPLDGAALRRLAAAAPNVPLVASTVLAPRMVDDEIDGVPMEDDDIDGVPLDDSSTPAPGFIPSKWEFVDPSQVEAQAVTTSQWERLEVPSVEPRAAVVPSPRSDTPTQEERRSPTPTSSPPPRDDTSFSEVSESRRALLRAVEVKALRYQDELESGRRALREGWTLPHQVQHHKRKLLKKMEREAKQKELEEASKDNSPEWVGSDSGRRSDSSSVDTSSRHRRTDRRRNSSDEDDNEYKTSTSRKSKRSKEVSLSPPPVKRSRHRSRSTSRTRSSRSSRRRSPSPVVRDSRTSLRESRTSLRDSRSPSSPTDRRREKETRRDKHQHSSRKHKHKHKY